MAPRFFEQSNISTNLTFWIICLIGSCWIIMLLVNQSWFSWPTPKISNFFGLFGATFYQQAIRIVWKSQNEEENSFHSVAVLGVTVYLSNIQYLSNDKCIYSGFTDENSDQKWGFFSTNLLTGGKLITSMIYCSFDTFYKIIFISLNHHHLLHDRYHHDHYHNHDCYYRIIITMIIIIIIVCICIAVPYFQRSYLTERV